MSVLTKQKEEKEKKEAREEERQAQDALYVEGTTWRGTAQRTQSKDIKVKGQARIIGDMEEKVREVRIFAKEQDIRAKEAKEELNP